MKRVYLEPVWKLHMGYHRRELIPYPPEGYEFVYPENHTNYLFEFMSRKVIGSSLRDKLGYVTPLHLLRSETDMFLRKPPAETALTMACNHIVLRNEPWVTEVASIWEDVGQNPEHFKRYKRTIENAFASSNCKGVLHFSNFVKDITLASLNCERFGEKLGVLPRAVHAKNFVKSDKDEVTLLFTGSANIVGGFDYRGGKEVLEVFRRLVARFRNLHLILRSEVPQSYLAAYSDVLSRPEVTWIPGLVSERYMDEIYRQADILVLPAHYENWLSVAEAMSYQLAVVGINTWGMSEFIRNNETGVLVPESRFFKNTVGGIPWTGPHARSYLKRGPFPDLLTSLEEAISRLLEHPSLRRSIGSNARREVEEGCLSIRNRNRYLKKVYDDATS